MSTNPQNRITRQVRISEENHRYLKLISAKGGQTISRLLDKAVDDFKAADEAHEKSMVGILGPGKYDVRTEIKGGQIFIDGRNVKEIMRGIGEPWRPKKRPKPSIPPAI